VTSLLLREQEVPQLVQLRLEALEARIDAGLQLGRSEEFLAELGGLTVAYPLRERFHAQLMLTYAQAGRQAEALSAFQRAREVLADELGVDPGPELRQLHQQILAGGVEPLGAARRPKIIRPAQLPADLGDFTGRSGQVKLLTELADSAGQQPGVVPICVVTGLGGIGKTSLAVHAAHKVRNHFRDGQLHARLGGAGARPAEPGELLGRFLRDLGADPAQIPVGEPELASIAPRPVFLGRAPPVA